MKIKTETILVVLAIILGLISTSLFIASGLFKSPITDSMLIVSFGSVVLYFTRRTGEDVIIKGGQVIFSLTSVLSVFYFVTQLSLGQIALSATFAAFTVILLMSAYYYTRDQVVLTEKRVKIFVIIIVLVFAIVSVVDVVSGTPNVETSINDNQTAERQEFRHKIGTLKITNPSLLPQKYDGYPEYDTCLTGVEFSEDRAPQTTDTTTYSNKPDIIVRNASADMMVSYPVDNLEEVNVETSDECPDSTDEATVHFIE